MTEEIRFHWYGCGTAVNLQESTSVNAGTRNSSTQEVWLYTRIDRCCRITGQTPLGSETLRWPPKVCCASGEHCVHPGRTLKSCVSWSSISWLVTSSHIYTRVLYRLAFIAQLCNAAPAVTLLIFSCWHHFAGADLSATLTCSSLSVEAFFW